MEKSTVQLIKQNFNPDRKKAISFLILFSLFFFWLPLVKISTFSKSKSLFWLVKNYSGSKEEFSIISSGFIIYFIASYFISGAIVFLISNLRGKKI